MKIARAITAALAVLTMAGCSTNSPTSGPTTTLSPVVTAGVPGQTIPPGKSIDVQDDLTPSCVTAVAPIRQLMKDYANGFVLDAEGAERLTAAMNAANDQADGAPACNNAEWGRFNELELRGWLAPQR